jgi:hypothetical protein
MKNIHVLPTPNPSRLYEFGNQFNIQDKEQENFRSFNIHITNNEEIKDSEIDTKVCIFKSDNSMITCLAGKGYGRVKTIGKYYEIILTTDQDLIKDGVQAIDDEFLEWFVKNPSCEEVKVELHVGSLRWSDSKNTYKIIIPKEGMNCWSGKKGVEGWPGKEEPKQEIPTELESVLAKITHQNDLGLSQWYEVVYYDDNKWCSYSGSKTFQDGERVIEWKYCKDCL